MINRSVWTTLIALTVAFSGCARTSAVELPGIFTRSMVLQRETPVPVWGKGEAGEKVTVEFAGQKKSATVEADGKWSVKLDPMPASTTPRALIVQGNNTLTVEDVVVGEVWLASGQSNMYLTFSHTIRDSEKELAAANDPLVRQFTVTKTNQDPQKIPGAWHTATRENLLAGGNMGDSALAYFFARDLRKELNVPVGVINSSFGGAPIEWFLPGGGEYSLLVQPLAPYAIRGFLWYQGESNLIQGDTSAYTEKMRTLVTGWRKLWGNDNLPFYYVQIAPYLYSGMGHSPEALPFFWEAQTKALAIPRTGMVVTTDLVDNVADIHPPNKQDVARRLVLLALAHDYGRKKPEYSGPVYKGKEVRGGKIILSFDHVAGGLVSRDGKPLTHFTIAGNDQKFVPAEVVIEGPKVIVSSAQVAEPVAVRFAWHETAMPNLSNKAGLPAMPFRTDDWPMPPNTVKPKS